MRWSGEVTACREPRRGSPEAAANSPERVGSGQSTGWEREKMEITFFIFFSV
jgi:hypothetical protein